MKSSIKRVFRSYSGRNFISRWARKLFERDSIQKHFGYLLASGLFVFSIIDPLTADVLAKQEISHVESPPIISEEETHIKTETTLSWPVKSPRITQGYRVGHWGIDVQDDTDSSIYPADEGWVSEVNYWNYGYGSHVYVQHPNGRSSLYAHLSSINVVVGQEVTRETVLGKMGRTGWASGVHLHFEVFQDGIALNPLTSLPENKSMVWTAYSSDQDVYHTTDEPVIVTVE